MEQTNNLIARSRFKTTIDDNDNILPQEKKF